MPGLKIVLPVPFTDDTLPILRDDAELTTGSLLLVDPTHSADPWASGVPADQAVIPNIAWQEAADTLGSGTQTTLAPLINVKGGINNNTKGKLERSGKGGLHGIVSQTVALANGDGLNMSMPALINTYLLANPTHSYYFSAWDRLTRVNSSGTGLWLAIYELGRGSTPLGLMQMHDTTTQLTQNNAFGSTGVLIDANPRSGTTMNNQVGGLVNRRISLAVTPGAGMTQTNMHFGPSFGYPPSSYNAAVIGSRNNIASSFVFYRCYLEDLTVSGRTFAQVEAIDAALHTAAFGSSGRYSGDTFTSPATLA